jgi:hypothetical protein
VSANRVTLTNPAGVGESVIIDLLSESSSTSILNERLVFNSLADVGDKAISPSVDNITVLSYAVPGDLRGMPMELSRVGIAPTFPGWVQSLDGAYWQLKMAVVTPFMFGAYGSGDSLHDDHPAIMAALGYCSNVGRDSYGPTARVTLHFPAGQYYSSQTINMLGQQRITGDGMGLYLIPTCTIQFPVGVTGISVDYPRTAGAWGALIEGLDLLGTPDPTNSHPLAHGVYSILDTCLHRVNCAGFSGSGFYLFGWNDPGDSLPGSTDLSRVDECNAWGNQQNGFYMTGQDANVITIIKCSAGSNGWYGFWDDSFLGCNFISCHSASNSFGGGVTGALGSIANYSGITYGVTPHYEQNTYPLPSTTVPGSDTDHSVWYPIVSTTAADDWVSGGLYNPGGPYCNTNLNARSVWLGCYAEGTSAMFYIGANNSAIFGGLLSAYIVGPAYAATGNVLPGGVTFPVQALAGVPADQFFNITIGTSDPSGHQVVWSTSAYSPGPGYNSWLASQEPLVGDFTFSRNYYSRTTDYSYLVTGGNTAHQFGSGAVQPYVFTVPALGLSEQIIIKTGTAPFGAAGIGWIVYNSNPVPGGNVGWVCTTGGASPVWKTFGAIAP